MNLEKKLEMAAASDPGRQRSQNEDKHHLDAANGFALVADGMGGHRAGEVASSLAVTLLSEELVSLREQLNGYGKMAAAGLVLAREQIAAFFDKANATIAQVAASQPQYKGMGTTATFVFFFDNHLVMGHVGDSRLYRLRKGRLNRISRDQTLVQELIDRGVSEDKARTAAQSHFLAQALGLQEQIAPDILELTVEVGDLFLLCSDGLSDLVEESRIQALLQEVKGLQDGAAALVEEANVEGGRDNITAVLVRAARPFPAAGGWLDRILR